MAESSPRLNANEDTIRVSRLAVQQGQAVAADELLAEVESDKTAFEIRAPEPGLVLRIDVSEGDMVETGAAILWIGESLRDEVPQGKKEEGEAGERKVTAKARALLAQYDIRPEELPCGEGAVTAAMVEEFLSKKGRPSAPAAAAAVSGQPPAPGKSEALTPAARAMLRTVSWQAQNAVPGYVEVPFDHEGWQRAAEEFLRLHDLLANPLLPLLAYRLVRIAAEHPALNATIVGGSLFLYSGVNLGFAVQSRAGLVMAVLRGAGKLSELGFVEALQRLQKRALAGRLALEETEGATVSLSSLANADVSRHIPVLPPQTSLIVAHTAKPASGMGVIGATYDHRLLDGTSVARALGFLRRPEL